MEAVTDWHINKLKPSSFTVYCLLCKVKDTRQPDVFLDLDKAERAGVKKSAYYFAFTQLEEKKWIKFTRALDGRKRWKLLKGFSANVENSDSADPKSDINYSANVEKIPGADSINAENSANVESFSEEIPQTWNENSANVESLIRINILKKEEETEESLSPHAPAREENFVSENLENQNIPDRETFGDNRRDGIPVHAMMNFRQDPQFVIYTNKIVEGLKIRHGTPKRLPNRDQWETKIEDAWHNEFPEKQCLEVYDLLEKIRTLRDGDWNITPRYWEENIPRVEKLRREVEKLEKGVKPKDAGNRNAGGKTAPNQRSDSELSDAEWDIQNSHLRPDYDGDDE